MDTNGLSITRTSRVLKIIGNPVCRPCCRYVCASYFDTVNDWLNRGNKDWWGCCWESVMAYWNCWKTWKGILYCTIQIPTPSFRTTKRLGVGINWKRCCFVAKKFSNGSVYYTLWIRSFLVNVLLDFLFLLCDMSFDSVSVWYFALRVV